MTPGDADPALHVLFEKIARERGFRCEAYKQGCLKRRIGARMRARGAATYAAYAEVLDGDAAEYDRLIDALTINVTKFYRNRETWDALATRILEPLWVRRGGMVRGWSAGCASGEEPYTLAMLLLDVRARHTDAGTPVIDATDVDRASLERAQAGRYPPSAFEDLPEPLRRRYVSAHEPFEVSAEVHALVRFHRHDVLRDPPPSPPYDLIMCRNVVIYFDRATQERLFLTFADALRAEGVLVLGRVETLVGAARERLVLEDRRERIFRKP